MDLNPYFGEYESILPQSLTAVGTPGHHNDIMSKFNLACNKVSTDLKRVTNGYLINTDWATAAVGYLVQDQDYSAHAYRVESFNFATEGQGNKVTLASGDVSNLYSSMAYAREMDNLLTGYSKTKADGSTFPFSFYELSSEGESIVEVDASSWTDREGTVHGDPTLTHMQKDMDKRRGLVVALRDSCMKAADVNNQQISMTGKIFMDAAALSSVSLSGSDVLPQVTTRQNTVTTVDYSGGKGPVGKDGLCIEAASGSQIIPEPSNFSDSSWIKSNVTVTEKTGASPNSSDSYWELKRTSTGSDGVAYCEVSLDSYQGNTITVAGWSRRSVQTDGVTVKVIDSSSSVISTQTLLPTRSSVSYPPEYVDMWWRDYVQVEAPTGTGYKLRIEITLLEDATGEGNFYGLTAWTDGISDYGVGKDLLASSRTYLTLTGTAATTDCDKPFLLDFKMENPVKSSWSTLYLYRDAGTGVSIYSLSYKPSTDTYYISVRDPSGTLYSYPFNCKDKRCRFVASRFRNGDGSYIHFFELNGERIEVKHDIVDSSNTSIVVGSFAKMCVRRAVELDTTKFYYATGGTF